MATYSEVKTGLDAIALRISADRDIMKKVKSNAGQASADLAALAADYAAVIAQINAYGTTDASEAFAKAEFAKLVTEYTALKSLADQVAAINLG
jgi:regulator of protease activity HflC (stomatin/prohibitin superfamily)